MQTQRDTTGMWYHRDPSVLSQKYVYIILSLQRSCSEKIGYVDRFGKQVIPATYDLARPFSEGLAAVSIGHKWGFINKSGTVQIQPRFDYVTTFNSGLAEAVIGSNYGYIDHSGSWVIPPKFPIPHEINPLMLFNGFQGELARVLGIKIVPKPELTIEYIDKHGHTVYGPKSVLAQ
jgi:hypothetical protein